MVEVTPLVARVQDWPKDLRSKPSNKIVDQERMIKAIIGCVVQPKEPFINFARFSQLVQLLETVVWIRRFICNSTLKKRKEFKAL